MVLVTVAVCGVVITFELRGRLEEGAEHWRAARARREKRSRVVVGLVLAEARALHSRWGAELPAEIRAFICASRRAAQRRRAGLLATVAGAVVALPVVALVAWAGLVWWGVRQVASEWAAEQEFVRIPAGCFDMGSPDSEAGRSPNEGPVHKVCIRPFDLAKIEVTQGEWRRVMIFPNVPASSYFKVTTPPVSELDRVPVEEVNWNEAQRFVWLMSVFGHGHYRLPSEGEWEYAARAGTTTSRYWGDNINSGCAYENIADQSLKRVVPDLVGVFVDCDDGYASTAPVASFKPNPWGLYDMLGNVMNWVEDCYVDNYRNTPTDGSPNTGGACTNRVIRGGFWYAVPNAVRAALRFSYYPPDTRNYFVGLRLARTVAP